MKTLYLLSVVVLSSLLAVSTAFAVPPDSKNFVAPLSGREEVPVRDTNARGNTIFQLNREGTELSYKLIVANIENVFAAHIHCGAAGVAGPVGVTLFTGPVGGGRTDGILAQGVIVAPDPGNACGWADLAAVVAALRTGQAYVNVHTNDGLAPVDTGPGDFPAGEIRGQIKEGGPS
ncbi:MAG: CHRD domain-containing protein [Anaerolineales bacterium]